MANKYLLPWWRIAGCLSAVIFVVLLGVLFWSWPAPVPVAQTPSLVAVARPVSERTDASTLPTVVLPANPILDMYLIRQQLGEAVRAGQKISVVQFIPDRLEPASPAGTDPFRENNSATQVVYIADRSGPGEMKTEHWIEICGEFKEIRDLQNGFKNLGHIHKMSRIPGDPLHAGDPRWRLLLAARPEKPMLLLSLSIHYSTNILDALFLGPLLPSDERHLAEVVQFLKQFGSPSIGAAVGTSGVRWANPALRQVLGSTGPSAAEAEKLLTSENPWLIWLGLDWLARRGALKARHYREVIERRPLVETETLVRALLSGATFYSCVRNDLLAELEALIQLPEKQLVVLKHIGSQFAEDAMDYRRWRCVSYTKLHAWLVGYKERLAKTEGNQDVIAAIDEVLPVLTPDP